MRTHVVTTPKKILIAPLNWGLGHASRCIPIINKLLQLNFEPIIASDGEALVFLRKEFPGLKHYELPGYNIKYSRYKIQKIKLFLNAPKIFRAVLKEKQTIEGIHKSEHLSGIISDNRFGVRHEKIPSVYITHQLNVLSGITTPITSFIHQKIISKFNECWVPDSIKQPNLSGYLSTVKRGDLKIKYIGAISRLTIKPLKNKYKLMILLSGPEPQRTILEEKLLTELKEFRSAVLFIRGVLNEKISKRSPANITMVNYMITKELEQAINDSDLVISRSGYSTILDLAKLGKKAFFIPTPGQYEQLYLAKRMEKLQIAPFEKQDSFRLKMLDKAVNYTGFKKVENDDLNSDLFNLF